MRNETLLWAELLQELRLVISIHIIYMSSIAAYRLFHCIFFFVKKAFGSPIGGVLFSLEEAASFFSPDLILKTLVASIISSFTLNLVLSLYHGTSTFSYPGLFNLGKFEELPYTYYEIPIFMCMGCIGGVLGALWVFLNTKLSIFRGR